MICFVHSIDQIRRKNTTFYDIVMIKAIKYRQNQMRITDLPLKDLAKQSVAIDVKGADTL